MAYWQATNAKAKFSGLLDAAETEGPQLIHRRKREFYVMTKEQFEKSQSARHKPFVSAWDALAPSSGVTFEVDFPRLRSKARAAKF